MSLTLTPEVLAAGYTFLRSSRPFNRWKLPSAHKIKFKVTNSDTEAGYCRGLEIGISKKLNSHTTTVLAILAHEMIHLYLDVRGVRQLHRADFKRAARRVCAEHGFDAKHFF